MTAVGGTDTGYVVVGAVGVGRIAVVIVLGYDMIFALGFRQMELALAMGHPQTELGATQTSEHHALVLRDTQADELTLELMAVVV